MNIRQELEQGLYTTDISQARVCGHIRWEFQQIQKLWNEKGLPKGFDDGDVMPLFRKDGAGVVLINGIADLCVLDSNVELAMWHCCSDCSKEGFDLEIHGENGLCDACYLADTDNEKIHRLWGTHD